MTNRKNFEGYDLNRSEFEKDPEKAITEILEFLGVPHTDFSIRYRYELASYRIIRFRENLEGSRRL